MAEMDITAQISDSQARQLRYVRAVDTARGAGTYYYFDTGRAGGKPVYVRLPRISDADFMARYDALVANRGSVRRPARVVHLKADSVYFVGVAKSVVKIGRTADIRGRLPAIQSSFPRKLTVLAIGPGLGSTERDYHRRFADCRMNGEWFGWSPEIEGEIENIRARFPAENGS